MHSLQKLNSFGVAAFCSEFVPLDNENAAKDFFKDRSNEPFFILGGGSNILITEDIESNVLHNCIKGIELISEDEKECVVKVGAGQNWHQFVLWTLGKGLGNLENLSLIPGTVGAAPMQNIGAYGEEVGSYIVAVHGIDCALAKARKFKPEECEFDYRSSIFKTQLRDKILITHVEFRLSKIRQVNSSYGAIKSELQELGVTEPGIEDVSKAVINIRSSKLPDPNVVGNAGSFFKNPIVSVSRLKALLEEFPEMPHYQMDDQWKLAAGWLIDRRGWKGKRVGNTGCYEKQALVIVNHGGATGQEILDHARNVAEDVHQHFGIQLTPEVNIIGATF